MKTKSKVKAISFSKILLKKFNFIKDYFKMGATKEEIQSLVFEFANTMLEETEKDLYIVPNPEDTVFALCLDDLIKERQDAYFNNNFNAIRNDLIQMLNSSNITLNKKDLEDMSKTLLNKQIEDLKLIKDRLDSKFYKKPKITSNNTINQIYTIQTGISANGSPIHNKVIVNVPVIKNYRLEDCVKAAIKQFKYEKPKHTKDSLQTYEYQGYLLMLYFGEDKDVYTITDDDLKELRNLYFDLPAKFKQMNIFKNKDLEYIVANSEEMEKISETTIYKYIIKANYFFGFFNKKRFTSSELKIVQIPKPDGKEREKYTDKELELIYNKMLQESEENKFICLLMMLHGTRLKEITQLTKNDIKEEDGYWYLDINKKNNKTVKNNNSIRRVPIHDKLIELGFLDFVDNKQNGLFNITNRDYSQYFRKKINTDTITKDPMKTLYSLRHNFIRNLLKIEFINVTYLAATVGHEKQYQITMGTYGEPFPIKFLKEHIIDKLNYPFI
jgi:integrase